MKLTRLLIYFLILAAIIGGLYFYSWVLLYIVSSVVFTYIFNPWISLLERNHIPRLFGIVIVYVTIGLVLALCISTVIPVIVYQAHNFTTFIRGASEQGDIHLLKIQFFQNILSRIDIIEAKFPILKLHDQFIKLINNLNSTLINIPGILVKNYNKILGAISLIAMIPLIGFFLLKDSIRLRKDFLKLVPNRYFEIVIILMHKVDEIVGKYLRAMFYEVIIVGSLVAIVLTILGVDYAFLIGFLAGLANIIPYFGPILGVLFAVISILISGSPLIMIVYVIIAMYFIQVFDNNVVYPIVIGTSINMHPLIVLLTVLAGGWSAGILGMLVSVPIVYLVYNVLKVLYVNLKEYKLL